MAFSEFEIVRYQKLCEEWGRRKFPPAECLGQLSMTVTIEGQTIQLAERRPHWREVGEFVEHEFAKLTWVKTSKSWKLYWLRGSTMQWTLYEPHPVFPTLEAALTVIEKDEYACFFG